VRAPALLLALVVGCDGWVKVGVEPEPVDVYTPCSEPCETQLPHATMACLVEPGSCQVLACETGWRDCDGLESNSCETQTDVCVGTSGSPPPTSPDEDEDAGAARTRDAAGVTCLVDGGMRFTGCDGLERTTYDEIAWFVGAQELLCHARPGPDDAAITCAAGTRCSVAMDGPPGILEGRCQ